MQVFWIITKVLLGMIGLSWNIFMKITNSCISCCNDLIRKKNDQKNRGVIELKQGTIDDLISSNNQIENTVISGGNKDIRAEWIAQLVSNSYHQGYPVIVLHEGNTRLQKLISVQLPASETCFIDSGRPHYEPFSKYSSKEIAKFLLDSATKDYDLKKNAAYYIEGMCDFLKFKKLQPTLHSFSRCPHMQLFDKIDGLVLNGSITDTESQMLKSKLMTGQTEQIKIESFIKDLYDQFEPILSKTKGENINIALERNKVLVIDVFSNMNNLLINFLLTQIRYAVTKKQRLIFVTEGLSAANNEMLQRFLVEKSERCKLITCGDDIFAACSGDDKIFHTLVGNCENIIILGHASGTTCTKWSETIGYYNKEEESQTFQKGSMKQSPFSLFPGSNVSASKSYSIKREYIVRPELINRMNSNEVYVYNHLTNKLLHTFIV